jgi:predicted lipoprotein with Yx(FWY)xxD motif
MKTTVLIGIATSVLAVVIAAGCGSSAKGSAYSSGSYSAAAVASAHRAGGATRVAVASSQLGRIVVDGKGRTLYLFEKDKNRHSACYGPCATYWPPLLTHGKPVARAGAKQSLLGTTRRANGSRQVTYGGHPLYRYALDGKPGQTSGEGLQDFGGGWDAVSPAGKKVESDG